MDPDEPEAPPTDADKRLFQQMRDYLSKAIHSRGPIVSDFAPMTATPPGPYRMAASAGKTLDVIRQTSGMTLQHCPVCGHYTETRFVGSLAHWTETAAEEYRCLRAGHIFTVPSETSSPDPEPLIWMSADDLSFPMTNYNP